MYGGSGMCPSASTSASTSPPPSAQSRMCGGRGNAARAPRAISTPAGPSNRTQRAGLQLLAGMHRARPQRGRRDRCRSSRDGADRLRWSEQQALDRAAARHAVPEQASGEDARVVDDQQIAGAQDRRQLRDRRVLQRVRSRDRAPAAATRRAAPRPARSARPADRSRNRKRSCVTVDRQCTCGTIRARRSTA